MMTVGELKDILNQYDEDLPVCIGEIQSFGSNFATELDTVDELFVENLMIILRLEKCMNAQQHIQDMRVRLWMYSMTTKNLLRWK